MGGENSAYEIIFLSCLTSACYSTWTPMSSVLFLERYVFLKESLLVCSKGLGLTCFYTFLDFP